ncbi:major facilitator superfamily domain-containing protein [Aspergillus alliaceus]|uniref:major facilitator superfamily domain-containing protein n=1 Tax=Petromyces alliaceus TaxID=209559 RepID=UPI0012A4A319|nr:major facilitator superfamily domain-containing protein [Aspergillus alliaceus]KAB8239154.1 major facilitator superfamily domain-containing protein [Aspergillus alliaceus]
MGSSVALSQRSRRSGGDEQPVNVTTGAVDEATTVEPIPDGGYGWVVIFVCFIYTFWQNAWTGSWGILQVALLESTLRNSTSSTIGILLYSISNITSAWAVSNVGGLFITCGFTYGLGTCLIYTMSNSLPIQWLSTKLGTVNGIGATVMAIVTGLLTQSLGIAWTFRIFGLLSQATGIPAPFIIDPSLFNDLAFSSLFAAGIVGVFSIYAPPFFLPAITHSLGFSPCISAAAVACFNACMVIGRLSSGFACDSCGSMNILLLAIALNTFSMFAIWSVASTLPILIVSAVLNGLANGAFFVALPAAVGRLAGARRGAGAVSIMLTGWTPGLLVGSPIAGVLIDATGAGSSGSIRAYSQAIFYGDGTALLSLGTSKVPACILFFHETRMIQRIRKEERATLRVSHR